MRRTLYRKLILIYVILAIAGFTLISTVIVMGVSGSITQFVIRKGKKKEE